MLQRSEMSISKHISNTHSTLFSKYGYGRVFTYLLTFLDSKTF